MANPRHLQLLLLGVESWNDWRVAAPNESPDLSGADLADQSLTGANLKGADLHEVNLSGADLSNADLRDAALWHANLRDANLSTSKINNADLRNADLSGAVLFGASLAGANLMQACFASADLFAASLEGTQLADADFTNADLREARKLVLDNSLIRGTHFSAGAKDPWSLLRRRYTGPMMAFHLIFLLIFLGPHVFGALAWVSINRVQSEVDRIQEELSTAASTELYRSVRADRELKDALNALRAREKLTRAELEMLESIMDKASAATLGLMNRESRTDLALLAESISPCLSENCAPPRSVLLVLLGYGQSRADFILAICLVLYNFLRAVLTWRVSLLRDVEERSGYSPKWTKYRPLFYLNAAATALFYVALSALVYHAWHFLIDTTVILPATGLI